MSPSHYRIEKRILGAVIRQCRNQRLTQMLEQDVEYRTHLVSPHDIRFSCQEKFPLYLTPRTVDGDWDELKLPFDQLDIYKSFACITQEKSDWTDTALFQRLRSEIKSGKGRWGCRSEDDLLKKLRYFEGVFDDMREFGYIASHDYDQISVGVGRHGDLLLSNGRLRLTFAKLLNIPHIPVTIAARHPEWVKFKREILNFALHQSNRKLYAPALHPDLESIPAYHSNKRFELIRRNLISKTGKMLDIGCHWGYFCHRFEELGFECTGVEIETENFYFLERLKRACNRKFHIVNQSIFDYVQQSGGQYEVVLALAIFHHFVKTEENLQRLKKLLAELRTREMYFLPHLPSESQMRDVYWNPTENEFVDFILKNSRLTNVRHIGYAMDGRSLYQLT